MYNVSVQKAIKFSYFVFRIVMLGSMKWNHKLIGVVLLKIGIYDPLVKTQVAVNLREI